MNPSDRALIEKWITARDADAFADIVSRHSGMVYATCLRILRNPTQAEDVTQECFLALATKGATVRSSIQGWLHKLATHRSLDQIRAEKRRENREDIFAQSETGPSQAEWGEAKSHIDEVIAELPEKLRGPVIAHFLEGRTYQAIAETLAIPPSTVASRSQKGIQLIRRSLKKRGILVSTASLAALLGVEAAEATAVPASLVAALGKVAIACKADFAAAAAGGTLVTSKLAIVGGTILMWKNVSLAVGAVALALSVAYYTRHTRKEVPATPSFEENRQAEAPAGAKSEAVRSIEEREIAPDQLVAVLNKLLAAAQSRETTKQRSSGGAEFSPYSSESIPPDNGAHYFLLATELLPDVDMDLLYTKWQELQAKGFPDDPEFRAMLEKFQDAFDAIRTGLEVGNAEMPLPRSLSEVTRHPLPKFRHLARVMTMGAQYYAALGYSEAAFDDYATVLGFASESSRGGVLIAGLVGFAIDKYAAESLRETLTWGGAEYEDYRFLIEQMQTLDTRMHTTWEVMETEASLINSWLDKELEAGVDIRSMLEGDEPEMRGVLDNVSDEQIELMFRQAFEMYQTLVDYFALPYYEAQAVDLNAIISQNPISQVLDLPVLATIHSQEAAARAEIRGTMLCAAIGLYDLENKVYPASLDELVPDYASELPEDPFSGQPFGYEIRESSYLLYSVGPDMRDNGGLPLDGNSPFADREGDILMYGE